MAISQDELKRGYIFTQEQKYGRELLVMRRRCDRGIACTTIRSIKGEYMTIKATLPTH
jgi:hypothetical protein